MKFIKGGRKQTMLGSTAASDKRAGCIQGDPLARSRPLLNAGRYEGIPLDSRPLIHISSYPFSVLPFGDSGGDVR